LGQSVLFSLVEGPYHEQTIKLNVFTKVKNRFGAQLDLPRFDNQKKRLERSSLSHSAEAVILDSIICCPAVFFSV